jgi:hypothetical protein
MLENLLRDNPNLLYMGRRFRKCASMMYVGRDLVSILSYLA